MAEVVEDEQEDQDLVAAAHLHGVVAGVAAVDTSGAETSEAVVVTSLPSLLRVTECRTLREVAEHVENATDLDVDCEMRALGPRGSEGFEIRIGRRGTEFGYPFELTELYRYALTLEEECYFEAECEWLADAIDIVEGIRVWADIDFECDSWRVRRDADRRDLITGVVIQTVPDYPYERAMNEAATFAEGKAKRFDRHFAGLDVVVADPTQEARAASITLGELRSSAKRLDE